MPSPRLTNAKPLSKMIGELAVVACIQTTALGMSKLDKQASSEADQAHAAKQGAGKLNVSRMPGCEEPVAEIKKVHRDARDMLISKTTQWGPDRRLLLNMNIGEVAGEMDVLQREHKKLVDRFVDNAASYIAKAKANLGSYNIEPPTEDEIAMAFSMNFDITPVPDVSSFSTNDKKLEQQLKERFEKDIESQYQEAQKDLLKRLAKPIENLVTRMSAYEEREALKAKKITVGKEGTFKSTIISNITDIASIFDGFNITKDPLLMEIGKKLHAFDGIEHTDLVKSKELREVTAKKAAEIRELLGDWL